MSKYLNQFTGFIALCVVGLPAASFAQATVQVSLPSGATSNTSSGTTTAFYSFWALAGQSASGSGSGYVTWSIKLHKSGDGGPAFVAWVFSEQRQAQAKLAKSGSYTPSGSARGWGTVGSTTLDTGLQVQSATADINVNLDSGQVSSGTEYYWGTPEWLEDGDGFSAVVTLGTKYIAASMSYVKQAHGASPTDGARAYAATAVFISSTSF